MQNSNIYFPAEDSYLMSGNLEKEVAELLKVNSNLKFLEIGCGSGINLETALKCGVKKEKIINNLW